MCLRNYEYRIYPSRKQISRLNTQFWLSKQMYNMLLTIRKDTYLCNCSTINKFDMCKIIKRLKEIDTKFKGVHSQVLQNTADRLSKAFSNFFRRVKEKKAGNRVKVGFPRYKKRFKSITYPQKGFKFISDKKLYISKIGNVPIILHRVPKGKVKTMTIKRMKSGKWFVVFSCEIESNDSTKTVNDKVVGIDVGLENFATLSDGTIIDNPRHIKKSEKRLKRLHRRVSRKVKGSNNRWKAIKRLNIQYEKVTNQRKDFLHKTSRFIADNYGIVAVENLNINGMLSNGFLAKHIADASWGTFLNMTAYKVESTRGKFVVGEPFDPTTQECSGCGAIVPKTLKDRMHNCPSCGLVMPRDLNSAINIRNTAGQVGIYACGDSTSVSRPERDASGVVETGTICR